jgi:hypothetical protein
VRSVSMRVGSRQLWAPAKSSMGLATSFDFRLSAPKGSTRICSRACHQDAWPSPSSPVNTLPALRTISHASSQVTLSISRPSERWKPNAPMARMARGDLHQLMPTRGRRVRGEE